MHSVLQVIMEVTAAITDARQVAGQLLLPSAKPTVIALSNTSQSRKPAVTDSVKAAPVNVHPTVRNTAARPEVCV